MTQVQREPGVGEGEPSHALDLLPHTQVAAAALFAPRDDDLFWTPGAPQLNIVDLPDGGQVVAGVEREYSLPTGPRLASHLRSILRAAWLKPDGTLQIELHSDFGSGDSCGIGCISCATNGGGSLEQLYRGDAMPEFSGHSPLADSWTATHLARLAEIPSDSDPFVPGSYNFEPWMQRDFGKHGLSDGLRLAVETRLGR